jgi:site-specific DNA-methyltransferase (adenine-specific)
MKGKGLVHGDCIAELAQLEPASVDLVFADPPFNIGYEYDAYDDRRNREHYLTWTRSWGQAIERVLKPTGTFWLAIGDDYAAELKLIFQNDLGFHCRSWVVWYYTFGVNCTKKFSRSHTHLFHFVKDPTNITFNEGEIRVPSARQLVYADRRANSRGRLPDDTWILRPQDVAEGFQPHEDTWYFSRVCGTFKERAGWHGCQMPEQLLGRIIRVCSNPGDVVLDPFAGSGTTLVVAKKLGRRWLGFELSENYAARAQARLDAAAVGQCLEGAEEPKVSAPPTPGRRRARNGRAKALPGYAACDMFEVAKEDTMADAQLTLTTEERQYLVGLLETTLKEVRVEEHRTRTPSYREHVVHQEDLIKSVLGKLGQPAK